MGQNDIQDNAGKSTRVAGFLAVVAGLILLGMCLSQWNADTGSTMGRAMSAYNSGDRGVLAGFGNGTLRQTSQTGVEGLAGLFWLGLGAFLLKRAGATGGKPREPRYTPPPRR